LYISGGERPTGCRSGVRRFVRECGNGRLAAPIIGILLVLDKSFWMPVKINAKTPTGCEKNKFSIL